MIQRNVREFAAVRTPVWAALAVIGLVSSTPFPLLAQTSGTWVNTGTLNTPRTAHTATLLASGLVLVVGGENTGGFLVSAELYNPVTGKWIVTGSMSVPRIDHSATLLPNGQVLVAGGETGAVNSTATAELYNPSTGAWKSTGSMIVPRALHGAVLLQNGQVLVAGGSNSDGSASTSAELYNPFTGTWKPTGNMPTGQISPVTLLLNSHALVAGGDTAEVYDPSNGEWILTPNLYYGTSTGISTALLANGYVLIYGNKFSCYAGQFYNPSTNGWARTLGQCGNSISHGPLTLLGSGRVLLAGSTITYSGKSFPTSNCRLYDPPTNTWLVTGSLKQSVPHSATRLLNGQVLAVGGADAELYIP
jgi:N-acetylneuraminic acid mutarotase